MGQHNRLTALLLPIPSEDERSKAVTAHVARFLVPQKAYSTYSRRAVNVLIIIRTNGRRAQHSVDMRYTVVPRFLDGSWQAVGFDVCFRPR